MLTRIQLNLLGRRSYLSSVVSLATGSAQSTINLENHDDGGGEYGNDYANDPDKADEAASYYGSDFETNRKYLTFSWWLLNRGWTDIMERVESAVRDVFGHLSPRDLLSLDTFSQLVLEVRKKVEGGDPAQLSDPATTTRGFSTWLSFLLPPSTLEDFVLRESGVLGDSAAAVTSGSQVGDAAASVAGSTTTGNTAAPRSPTPASLRRLLDETSDLIESPAFTHVLTRLLDAGFSFLLHRKLLPGAFEAGSNSNTTTTTSVGSISEVASATAASLSNPPAYADVAAGGRAVMLPKILSVLTRQAHAVGAGMPNEYLREMELVRDLEAFAAVVYSSNWENEIRQDGTSATGPSPFASLNLGAGAGAGLGDQNSLRGSTLVDESLVIVDPHQAQQQPPQSAQSITSFDAAWEKATGRR